MEVEGVHDKESFLEFVIAMQKELGDGAKGWVNTDLAAFLEAMAAWAHDWRDTPDANPWRHAAALMRAGAFYE